MNDTDALHRLARDHLGWTLEDCEALPGGGSSRHFYRCRATGPGAPPSVIGVAGEVRAEVQGFLYYTEHFAARGIPVPRIHAADPDADRYLMEDLGGATLADRLRAWRAAPGGAALALNALHGVVRWLAYIQVRGAEGLDVTRGAEGPELGEAAFRRDIEGFLRHYVPRFVLTDTPLDAAVRGDLDTLLARLGALPREHFCYRDFQARNVMWCERTDPPPVHPFGGSGSGEGPVFLDYQAGRRGPLAYDLAALLYSPDTGADDDERALLIEAYLQALDELDVTVDRDAFLADFYPMVLLRRLQALGAYARIGVNQHKPRYLEKIPPALATLRALLADGRLALGLPALERWLGHLLAGSEHAATHRAP